MPHNAPYSADKKARRESDDELRDRIPGWGVDADPADRPSVPRERFAPEVTGAHWDYPEEQRTRGYRERSIEHEHLTPVFGTSAPLKGLSGAMRRLAYARFSEGRAAHWLLLLASDRVDVFESRVTALASGHPDNPVTETGIAAEREFHGVRSRFGRKRADLAHIWMDPVIVAGPWIALGVAVVVARRSGRSS